jgi:hypothetical protein
VVSPGRTEATNTGIIRWRADYGGAQDYTMFLPTQKMLADMSKEMTS